MRYTDKYNVGVPSFKAGLQKFVGYLSIMLFYILDKMIILKFVYIF